MSRKFITFLLLAMAAACAPASGDYAAAGLKCEYAVDPAGIETPAPRLSWRIESGARGQRQTAWQVLAASSPGLLAGDRADLWDSGKVATDLTTHVPYGGAPLAPSQQVYWKVRSWDRDGKPSAWSEPATWTMGQLSPADWAGRWIRARDESESILLRRSFEARGPLKRALLHVSGLGHYELFVNGSRAGADLLTPGWTNYARTTLYDTLDLTAAVREGVNVIGVHLGNGMYQVDRRERFSKFEGSFGPKRLIADLRLEYADGTTEVIGTDAGWLTHAGPVTFSNIYGGEDHDARLLPDRWSEAGGDTAGWTPAVVVDNAPLDTLKGAAAAADPVRVIEVRQPVEARPLAAPGGTLYDFGQNTSYMPRLTVSGPRGSRIILTPGELVYPDGYITRSSMGGVYRGFSWLSYTKGSDGIETWTPAFFYIGSRYFQAQAVAAAPGGELPVIESLEGLVVHSAAAPAGGFATSNGLLNDIRQLVRWAQRSNMVSILTDCPHREKLGWLEQYHMNGPAIRYEFDVNRIFRKGMLDMADSQDGDGLIPNIAPEYTRFSGTFRAAAEWGSAFIMVPWQQYLFTGDTGIIERHYDAMTAYYGYLERRAVDGILSEGLGDWYDLGPRRLGRAELTLPPLTATAFLFHNAAVLSAMAELTGRRDDAVRFAARAEQVRRRFNEEFFNAEGGYYGSNSQAANAIALAIGLVEPAQRERVIANLVQDVADRGYTMTAGDVGFRYLLRALADAGRNDVVYRMINHQRYPGYGYQLLQGATALTETWGASRTSSNNHFMLGHVTEWFYHDLLGIQPVEEAPGFKRVRIEPDPVEGLAWAEGHYDSLHGRISVRWDQRDGTLRLRVGIPANTTAEVRLPAEYAGRVSVDGVPLERAEGVRFHRVDRGRVVLDVESGSYDFLAGEGATP